MLVEAKLCPVSGSLSSLELTGVVDHMFHQRIFDSTADIPQLLIDVGGVEQITSFGVREWKQVFSRVGWPYYGFLNCRSMFVWQLNTVRDFAGQGDVLTVYCSYECAACEHLQDELLNVIANFTEIETGKLPVRRCRSCGATASEFDEEPNAYFQYIIDRGCPQPPQEVLEFLRSRADD